MVGRFILVLTTMLLAAACSNAPDSIAPTPAGAGGASAGKGGASSAGKGGGGGSGGKGGTGGSGNDAGLEADGGDEK